MQLQTSTDLNRLAVLAIALLASGCSQWPRASNLPATGDVLPSTVDVATLFDVTWADAVLYEPDPIPGGEGVQRLALKVNDGLHFEGELAGIGFDLDAVPTLPSKDGCGSGNGRSPVDGDYVADVDNVVLDLERGTFCASVVLSAADDVAFDLLLFPLDGCDLPQAPVDNGGEPLGLNGYEGQMDWHKRLEAGAWDVQLAGWNPIDATRFVSYHLWLSVVDSAPGDGALCPLPPVSL